MEYGETAEKSLSGNLKPLIQDQLESNGNESNKSKMSRNMMCSTKNIMSIGPTGCNNTDNIENQLIYIGKNFQNN